MFIFFSFFQYIYVATSKSGQIFRNSERLEKYGDVQSGSFVCDVILINNGGPEDLTKTAPTAPVKSSNYVKLEGRNE